LKLTAVLFLYCYESALNDTPGDEQTLAATQINQLLKAIDDALLARSKFWQERKPSAKVREGSGPQLILRCSADRSVGARGVMAIKQGC